MPQSATGDQRYCTKEKDCICVPTNLLRRSIRPTDPSILFARVCDFVRTRARDGVEVQRDDRLVSASSAITEGRSPQSTSGGLFAVSINRTATHIWETVIWMGSSTESNNPINIKLMQQHPWPLLVVVVGNSLCPRTLYVGEALMGWGGGWGSVEFYPGVSRPHSLTL